MSQKVGSNQKKISQLYFLLLHIESHPNYAKFAPLLSEGWIPGRKIVCFLVFFSHISPYAKPRSRMTPIPSIPDFEKIFRTYF